MKKQWLIVAVNVIAGCGLSGLTACSGSNLTGSSTNNSDNGITSTTLNPTINIGQVATIPAGAPNPASALVSNNGDDNLILETATYTLYSDQGEPSSHSALIANSLINVSQCQSLQARGSCGLAIQTPPNSGNGQYLLNMTFRDPLTDNRESASQLIAYSNAIPELENGLKIGDFSSTVYRATNTTTTLSLPMLLSKNFSGLKVSSYNNNPAVVPSLYCPNNNFNAGQLCTIYIKLPNTRL